MISEVHTHPQNAGNRQYIYHECCFMKSMGWQIDYLYWGSRLDANVDEMKTFFGEKNFHFVNLANRSIYSQIKREIRNRLDKYGVSKLIALKYEPDELFYEDIGRKVAELHQIYQYDIVWLQYYGQSKAFDYIDSRVLKVIDTHDKFANRNRKFQKKFKVPEYIYLSKKGEKKALSRADMVIAIQDYEKKYFERLLRGTNTIVKCIGMLAKINRVPQCNAKNYGFIGAGNVPNTVGVMWFIRNVLPIIKNSVPDSNFVLAGGVCNNIPKGNYYYMGTVDNIEDFYSNIIVAVNPIQIGTGLNIKSIEATSFLKPLVTTTIGSRGIENNEQFVIGDTPSQMADLIITLLCDEEKRTRMSVAAEEFINMYNDNSRRVFNEIGNLL